MTNTFKSILVLIFACITLFVSSKELVQFSGYVKDNESLARSRRFHLVLLQVNGPQRSAYFFGIAGFVMGLSWTLVF